MPIRLLLLEWPALITWWRWVLQLYDGTISTQADVTGRAAAADQILAGTTYGSTLNSDPYGALATFGLVSTNGLMAGQTFNMNGGGNAYALGDEWEYQLQRRWPPC